MGLVHGAANTPHQLPLIQHAVTQMSLLLWRKVRCLTSLLERNFLLFRHRRRAEIIRLLNVTPIVNVSFVGSVLRLRHPVEIVSLTKLHLVRGKRGVCGEQGHLRLPHLHLHTL